MEPHQVHRLIRPTGLAAEFEKAKKQTASVDERQQKVADEAGSWTGRLCGFMAAAGP